MRQPIGRLANAVATVASRSAEAYLQGILVVTYVMHAIVYGVVALMLDWKVSVTSSFMPIADLAVEHRMYLPTAAMIGVVVRFVADQVRRIVFRDHADQVAIGQWLGLGATMLVVTMFVVLTIRRNADYHDAIGMWNKVIAQRVLQFRAYGQIGQIHTLGMNKHKEAIPYFEKVIALAPEMSSGYSSLGGVWSKLGDHEKALAYYQKASALETNSASLVTNVGVQHAALGRWDEAMRFYGKALQIDPNNALAHNNMGVALNRLGNKERCQGQTHGNRGRGDDW